MCYQTQQKSTKPCRKPCRRKWLAFYSKFFFILSVSFVHNTGCLGLGSGYWMLSDSQSSVLVKVDLLFIFLETTNFTFLIEASVKHARISIIRFFHCFFIRLGWVWDYMRMSKCWNLFHFWVNFKKSFILSQRVLACAESTSLSKCLRYLQSLNSSVLKHHCCIHQSSSFITNIASFNSKLKNRGTNLQLWAIFLLWYNLQVSVFLCFLKLYRFISVVAFLRLGVKPSVRVKVTSCAWMWMWCECENSVWL